jgi:hypothetical protein
VLVAVNEAANASFAFRGIAYKEVYASITLISFCIVVTLDAIGESVRTTTIRVPVALTLDGTIESNVAEVTSTIIGLNTNTIDTALFAHGDASAVITRAVSTSAAATKTFRFIHTFLCS